MHKKKEAKKMINFEEDDEQTLEKEANKEHEKMNLK